MATWEYWEQRTWPGSHWDGGDRLELREWLRSEYRLPVRVATALAKADDAVVDALQEDGIDGLTRFDDATLRAIPLLGPTGLRAVRAQPDWWGEE